MSRKNSAILASYSTPGHAPENKAQATCTSRQRRPLRVSRRSELSLIALRELLPIKLTCLFSRVRRSLQQPTIHLMLDQTMAKILERPTKRKRSPVEAFVSWPRHTEVHTKSWVRRGSPKAVTCRRYQYRAPISSNSGSKSRNCGNSFRFFSRSCGF